MKMIMARFPVVTPLAILSLFNLNGSLKIQECISWETLVMQNSLPLDKETLIKSTCLLYFLIPESSGRISLSSVLIQSINACINLNAY